MPTTTNNTATDFTTLQWNDYLKITAYSLLLTIGCFMNFVSFIYFGFKTQRMKSNYRYFIAHLSFADLLCCLLVPIFTITEIINNGQWVLGSFTCTYINPIGRLTGITSGWILCGMTYERYRKFTKPFQPLSKRVIQMYLLLVWIFSLSMSLSFSFTSLRVQNGQCFLTFTRITQRLNIIKTQIKISIPSIIMIILCLRLKCFLVKENRRRCKSLNSKFKTDKSEKMVLYSAVSYLVCVLPSLVGNMVVNIGFMIKSQESYPIYNDIKVWTLIFFFANSVINVFIYAGRFKDFRKYILEWIICLFCVKKWKRKEKTLSSTPVNNLSQEECTEL